MARRIVIVGGGFAGVEAARRLSRQADVVLISRDNFLLFTPMLAEVAAADVEPRHIVSPLRQLCPHAELVIGDVVDIDPEARRVAVAQPLGRPNRVVAGDVLVLAAGSVPATFGVPGAAEHTLPFKTIADAERIRHRIVAVLEAASRPADSSFTAIAIVGAGYSGAELAAALADFLADAVPRFYPGIPAPRLVLVDAVEEVTPTLPRRLSQAAETALRARRVELRLGRRVTAVTDRGLELEGGERVAAGTVIWSAGVRASPLAAELGLPVRKDGRLEVDGWFRAGPGLFALGDVAAVPARGGVAPPTAQHAVRQGRWLGRHLLDVLDGSSPRPYRYRTMGELVSLGHRNAVGTVMGLRLSGLVAWLLWRSYYLLRLPTFLRKVRVAIDWTLDLVFPPDIAGLPSADLGPTPGL